MKLDGNTVFITGGGSGIGRGLAEAFHKLGNQVIISGRRKGHLADTVQANPGMHAIELNIEDPASIASAAREVVAKYPMLNVLINNAGIMHVDDVSGAIDDAVAVSTVTTNLFGPIRMTSTLVEHLKKQKASAIINVSSVLGFLPLAVAAVYSSTKAALHSYSQSLRYKLAGSPVRVLELAPPWVQTDLLNSSNEPRAMPLAEFIDETIKVLGSGVDEVLVERAKMLRNQAGPAEAAFIKEFNDVFQTRRSPLRVQKGFMTSTRTLPERTDGPACATFSHAPLYWALRRWMMGSWCSNSIHAFDFGKREALSHG